MKQFIERYSSVVTPTRISNRRVLEKEVKMTEHFFESLTHIHIEHSDPGLCLGLEPCDLDLSLGLESRGLDPDPGLESCDLGLGQSWQASS